jgi:hypothetical protein
MADGLGLSFSPTAPPGQRAGQRPTPVQQAIQTLSLRIPSRAGASAFTPQGLLPSPTESGGTVGGAPDLLLEAIKRLLFGTQLVSGGGPVTAPGGIGPMARTPDAGGTIPGPDRGGSQPPAAPIHPPKFHPGQTVPAPDPSPDSPVVGSPQDALGALLRARSVDTSFQAPDDAPRNLTHGPIRSSHRPIRGCESTARCGARRRRFGPRFKTR